MNKEDNAFKRSGRCCMSNPNKRKEDETYEAYRSRLRLQQKYEKNYLKGVLLWNSSTQGTYARKRHGASIRHD